MKCLNCNKKIETQPIIIGAIYKCNNCNFKYTFVAGDYNIRIKPYLIKAEIWSKK